MKSKKYALFSLVIANANVMRDSIEASNLSPEQKSKQLEELKDKVRARLYYIIQNEYEK